MRSSIALLLFAALYEACVPFVLGKEVGEVTAVIENHLITSEHELSGLISIEEQIDRDIETHEQQADFLKFEEAAVASDSGMENKEEQLDILQAEEMLQEATITNDHAFLDEVEAQIDQIQTAVEGEEKFVEPLQSTVAGKMFGMAALLMLVGLTAFVTNQVRVSLMKRRNGYVSLSPFEQVEPI